MSGFIYSKFKPNSIDLKIIATSFQQSYDYGCDTDEESMEKYLFCHIDGLDRVEFQYQGHTKF